MKQYNYFLLVILILVQSVQSAALWNSFSQWASSLFSTTPSSPRQNFFKDIMGVNESSFIQEPALASKSMYYHKNIEKPSVFFFKNSKTKEQYQAGFFVQHTIGELRAKTATKAPQPGTFSVIEAQNTSQSAPYRKQVDIGALQAHPKNRDAVFQVASNFSALEPTSVTHYPESGIEGYIDDHTQGPFAVISAAPGLIYRMYYVYYTATSAPLTWRQTKEHQINLLSKTKLPVVNGYVDFTQKLPTQPLSQEEYEALQIGFQGATQVTFGMATGNEHTVIKNPEQLINQVFTAGVDFGNTNSTLTKNPVVKAIAQQLLDAAYEGTIRAAAAYGKKKVYLTLIGGGVFANSLSSIVASLKKYIPVAQDLGLEVILIIYDGSKLSELDSVRETLKELVHATHGTYTLYSPRYGRGKKL